jgi:hypothetical protein
MDTLDPAGAVPPSDWPYFFWPPRPLPHQNYMVYRKQFDHSNIAQYQPEDITTRFALGSIATAVSIGLYTFTRYHHPVIQIAKLALAFGSALYNVKWASNYFAERGQRRTYMHGGITLHWEEWDKERKESVTCFGLLRHDGKVMQADKKTSTSNVPKKWCAKRVKKGDGEFLVGILDDGTYMVPLSTR